MIWPKAPYHELQYTVVTSAQTCMQAEEPCVWFGRPGGCSKWVAMAAAVGVFTSVDLCVSLLLALGGANLSHSYSSERIRRYQPGSDTPRLPSFQRLRMAAWQLHLIALWPQSHEDRICEGRIDR